MTYSLTTCLLISFIITGSAQDGESQQQDKQQMQETQQPQQKRQRLRRQRAQPTTDVSDEELKKFVAALEKVKQANKGAQQEMRKIIEEEGLSIKKYRQIYKSEEQPQTKSTASKEEMKKYKKAKDRIKSVQQETKKEIDKGIEETGLSAQRYKEIYQAVRNDRKLQKKVKKMQQQESSGGSQ